MQPVRRCSFRHDVRWRRGHVVGLAFSPWMWWSRPFRKRGLTGCDHGWIDGRNLIIEYRYAPSQDRLPAFAAELVALSPDLLLAPNPQAAFALKSATASIPIVFVGASFPEKLGIQSLARPGGNMTGLAAGVPGFTGKGLEILREMVPTASKIAILVNPGNAGHRLIVAEELPQMARNLGVALPIVEATTAEELDIAFASAAAQHADAINVFGDTLTVNNAPRITALAASIVCPQAISTDNSSSMAD